VFDIHARSEDKTTCAQQEKAIIRPEMSLFRQRMMMGAMIGCEHEVIGKAWALLHRPPISGCPAEIR
jgi:hypothetical protein